MKFLCPFCKRGVVTLADRACPVCGELFNFWSVSVQHCREAWQLLKKLWSWCSLRLVVKCPTCGKPVSLFTTVCPHCPEAGPVIRAARAMSEFSKAAAHRVYSMPRTTWGLILQWAHLVLAIGLVCFLVACLGDVKEHLVMGPGFVLIAFISAASFLAYKGITPARLSRWRRRGTRLTKMAVGFDLLALCLLSFWAIYTYFVQALIVAVILVAMVTGLLFMWFFVFNTYEAAKRQLDHDATWRSPPYDHLQRQGREGDTE